MALRFALGRTGLRIPAAAVTTRDTGRMRLAAFLLVFPMALAACSSVTAEPAAAPASSEPVVASGSTSPSEPAKPPVAQSTGRRLAGAPEDFVRVRDTIPQAVFEIRYFGDHNFLGRPVRGYAAPECWLTRPAARALARVQRQVSRKGNHLKIYDCFRPQRAVDDFVAWAADPADTTAKAEFYPSLRKTQLFPLGYIAEKSGHSRGSTVDLTLVPKGAGSSPEWERGDPLVACTAPVGRRFPDTSLDMGTGFDCFDKRANTANPEISAEQRANRRLLLRAMTRAGFTNYPEEWWHFTLDDEPYPDTYFDTEITRGE